jgi:hyaluronan synthase
MQDLLNSIIDSSLHYSEIIILLLPIGIIGIWRWSVWLLRKFLSFFYRMPKGNYHGTLSIITPVYNEDPEMFVYALESWKANQPDEIIAVIDYSNENLIDIFKDFSKRFSNAKLIITEKPGKRPALADGIKAATGDILALVDSDTIWSANIKQSLLAPFSNKKLGGVVARQDVLETNTLARKFFKIHLDNRYLFEFPFLAAVSNAMLCLSGRTAVYRREAVVNQVDKLVNETFWGKQMISGDDKTLTHLVHASGWNTTYLRDVKVYTPGVESWKSYMKQQLRWTRNGLRSDLKALLSSWIWKKHKMLALHMLDKFIQPITLLLGPAYLLVALYFKHWEIAVIIVSWWMVSRTIKLFPHLREKPEDIVILPLFILSTYWMAIVKVYALMTIDEQGWITRWDKTRLMRAHLFRKMISFSTTSAIFFGMIFVVYNYEHNVILAKEARERERAIAKQMKILKNNIFTFDRTPLTNDAITKMRDDAVVKATDDQYGYYLVRFGDSVTVIRNKFNLTSDVQFLDAATKRALNLMIPLRPGQKIAFRINDLRTPINKNIINAVNSAKPPQVIYERATNRIIVKQKGSRINLTEIRQRLPLAQRNLLERTTNPGEWILRANLYISDGVTLVLDNREVSYLKMKSEDAGFVWILSQAGNVLIADTKITSWDEKQNAPDVNYQNGRAYITAKGSGRMDVVRSEIAYLGYAGLPKRGGPFGGSYGISWKNTANSFRDRLLTGVVTNNKFHHNYFGFYTYGTTGMLVRDNEAYQNIEYGFDPHDDSNNMLIERNHAHHNGNHGIILSKRCFDNIIQDNQSNDNRLHGIMLDRQSNNNIVRNNTLYNNVDGVAVYDSHNNLVINNKINNNRRGIRLNASSAHNLLTQNAITGSSVAGIYIYDKSHNNFVLNNQIKGNTAGAVLKNANNNFIQNNFKTGENQKDGRVVEGSYANTIL